MANSPSFVQYAVDLLSPICAVEARRMFGGHGLFLDGLMFGLLDDGELFLKADEESRGAFVAAGCTAWVYPSPRGPMVTNYFRPPAAALENHEELRPWAGLAIATARRKAAAKKKKVTTNKVTEKKVTKKKGTEKKVPPKKATPKTATPIKAAKKVTSKKRAAGTRRRS